MLESEVINELRVTGRRRPQRKRVGAAAMRVAAQVLEEGSLDEQLLGGLPNLGGYCGRLDQRLFEVVTPKREGLDVSECDALRVVYVLGDIEDELCDVASRGMRSKCER